MKLDYKKFPSLEKTNELIEKAKNIHWPIFEKGQDLNEYIKKVKDIYFSMFDFLPFPCTILKATDFNLSLYRVRECEKFNNLDLFCEHSYPPIAFTNLGRCNLPGYPIFYSSNNPLTSLTEVIRQSDFKNKKYCISKWGIIQKNNIEIVTQNFMYSNLSSENGFKQLVDNDLKKYNETFKGNLSESQQLGLQKLLKYLHNEFINDENYNISAVLTHEAMYSNHSYSTDILIYPSRQSNKIGTNFAVHPNIVDNLLELQKLYIIQVNDFNHEINKFNLTFMYYGNVINNKIMWNEIPKSQDEFRKIINEDFTGILEE